MSHQPSFFVTGGTLPLEAASYVERKADSELLSALLAGDFCYVLNTRQMGKSSLMIRTVRRLSEQGIETAVVDLTSIGQNLTIDHWYIGILVRIAEPLGAQRELIAFWKENASLGPLQRFLDTLRFLLGRVPDETPLVIFIDEIDMVRSLPFSADEFFAGVRECYNRRTQDPLYRRLTLCLVGVATPGDQIQDVRISPFNIGRRIELSDFTLTEAQPLAVNLPGHAVALQRILFWTGGHPYLTQRLCRAVSEGEGRESVDAACQRLFLTKQAQESDDNLAFVRNRILLADVDLPTLLDLYRQIHQGKRIKDDETNPLCGSLRLSGVVRPNRGLLTVRNRIYRHVFDKAWIVAHLPGEELRRQRRAYRRGVLRTSAVATAIIGAMAVLAFQAQRQARRALAAEKAEREQKKTVEAQKKVVEGQKKVVEELNAQLAERNQRLTRSLNEQNRQKQLAQGQAKKAQLAEQLAVVREKEARAHQREARLAQGLAENREKELRLVRSEDLSRQALQLIEQGDPYAALTPLQQALTVDRDTPARLQHTQARIAGVLESVPRLAQEWSHTKTITWAGFSPEGTLALTASHDGTAQLWDVQTHQRLWTMNHQSPVLYAAFRPDGKRIATVTEDGAIWLWNRETRQSRVLLRRSRQQEPESFRSKVFWSANGERLAANLTDDVYIYEPETGKRLGSYRAPSSSCTFATLLSPNGKQLALLAESLTGVVITASPAGQFEAPNEMNFRYFDRYTSLFPGQYSQDGKRLLVGTNVGACVYDAQTAKPLSPNLTPDLQGIVRATQFSPDERYIAVGDSAGKVRVWDTTKYEAVTPLLTHRSRIVSVEFSPDSRFFVSASTDGTAQIWQTQGGKPFGAKLHHGSGLVRASFSPDGRWLITADTKGSVRIWATGAPPAPTAANAVAQVRQYELYQNGRWVAMTAENGARYVADVASGKRLFTLEPAPPKPDEIGCALRILHDPERLAVVKDGSAQIFDGMSGKPLTPLLQTGVKDYQCLTEPLGRYYLVRREDSLTVLDTATGKTLWKTIRPLVPPFKENGQVLISADSTWVVLAYKDGTVRKHALSTGRELLPPLVHTSPVSWYHVDRATGLLVTLTEGGEYRLWNLDTGKPLAPPSSTGKPIQNGVRDFWFELRPETARVVTRRRDNETVLLWNLTTGKPIPLPGSPRVDSFRLSEDGRHLAVALGRTYQVFDTQEGRRIVTLQTMEGAITALAFADKHQRFLASCDDGSVQVWDTRTGTRLRTIVNPAPIQHAFFTHEGRSLVVGDAQHIRVFDLSTGELSQKIFRQPTWLPGFDWATQEHTDGTLCLVRCVGEGVQPLRIPLASPRSLPKALSDRVQRLSGEMGPDSSKNER